MTYTFSIQEIDHDDGVWLCALDVNGEVVPLAMFEDDSKRKLFTKILNTGLQVAHARGAMGI